MDNGDKRKADIYRWIKIGASLSFLPFVLVAGPMAGYVLGNYLTAKFALPSWISAVLITVGFIASLQEAIKIVKFALRAQEKV